MKEIVDNTSVFLPNSISEMKRVATEFKLKNYNYISIPNAIDKSVFSDESDAQNNKFQEYKDCIICAARIEGRKSTLNLVRAVKDTNYKLVLVGNESQNQKKYVEQVHKEAGENVIFLGAIPHEDLKKLYKVAKVHVLASWMETPGLSSLEAAAMDVKSISKAIDIAYNTPFNPKLKEKILKKYIWEETAKETLKGYNSILKK
jgi:glycosyltransferase involved in cell wall biosynthesis